MARTLLDVSMMHDLPRGMVGIARLKAPPEIMEFVNEVTERFTDAFAERVMSRIKDYDIDAIFYESVCSEEKADEFNIGGLDSLSISEKRAGILRHLYDSGARFRRTEKGMAYKIAFNTAVLYTMSIGTMMSPAAKKLLDVSNAYRNKWMGKMIARGLGDGETGVAFHGAGHDIMPYVMQYGPDIEAVTIYGRDEVIRDMSRLYIELTPAYNVDVSEEQVIKLMDDML